MSLSEREIIAYAARLEGSGLTYYRAERDGSGNVTRLVAVPWTTMLPLIVAKTGLRIGEAESAGPPPPGKFGVQR